MTIVLSRKYSACAASDKAEHLGWHQENGRENFGQGRVFEELDLLLLLLLLFIYLYGASTPKGSEAPTSSLVTIGSVK